MNYAGVFAGGLAQGMQSGVNMYTAMQKAKIDQQNATNNQNYIKDMHNLFVKKFGNNGGQQAGQQGGLQGAAPQDPNAGGTSPQDWSAPNYSLGSGDGSSSLPSIPMDPTDNSGGSQ